MQPALVLDMGYQPHRIVGWQRAAELVYDGKAEVLETYGELPIREIPEALLDSFGALSQQITDWFIGCADQDSDVITVKAPSVVRLLRSVGRKRVVRFSRINVMTRDGFTCQYCGVQLPISKLNYDHVVPRAQGGRTTWTNVVTSCYDCNTKKGAQTPEQAGMVLRRQPAKPATLPIVAVRMDLARVPETWKSFWYWNVELEA